jgi:gluconate 2-dehydrogenase gamma chain
MEHTMKKVTRRSFVTTVGAASLVSSAALLDSAEAAEAVEPSSIEAPGIATPDVSVADRPTYLFFNSAEVLFVEAACERLIPADENGAGALGAWVPNYLDKQLGGAWGAGERLYRSGPWALGTATQGYQLPFTPAELFHSCLRAIDQQLAEKGTRFHEMNDDAQDAYLKSLESDGHNLDGVPSGIFFDILLKMSVEGFFADPAYGGNKDMVAWRMIGFPGAYADYYEAIDKHGVKFEREPMSLAEDARGHVHMSPDIPARL